MEPSVIKVLLDHLFEEFSPSVESMLFRSDRNHPTEKAILSYIGGLNEHERRSFGYGVTVDNRVWNIKRYLSSYERWGQVHTTGARLREARNTISQHTSLMITEIFNCLIRRNTGATREMAEFFYDERSEEIIKGLGLKVEDVWKYNTPEVDELWSSKTTNERVNEILNNLGL